jgi:hypothetical protein
MVPTNLLNVDCHKPSMYKTLNICGVQSTIQQGVPVYEVLRTDKFSATEVGCQLPQAT